MELNEKQYFLVPKCESCKCLDGAGHFCGDQTQYLEGSDCIPDRLYNCIKSDFDADSVNHCLLGCAYAQPGHAYCQSGIWKSTWKIKII